MKPVKKRIRLEFTATTDAGQRAWTLDKRLLALRMMLLSQVGSMAVDVFDQWLGVTTDSPDLNVSDRTRKAKR